MLKHLTHGFLKLFKGDLAVLVLVNLANYFVPHFFASFFDRIVAAKDRLKLLFGHRAVAIHIQESKDVPKILFSQQEVLFEGSCNKLSVVNPAIAICVTSFHHSFDIDLLHLEHLSDGRETSLQLIKRQESIIVRV